MGYQPNIPKHFPGDECPGCYPKGGYLVKKRGQYGNFLSCDRFPDCKYTGKYWGRGKESQEQKVKES